MRRLLPLAAIMAVAALVLTGCGSGPSRLGAAAIVGDRVITIEDIQSRLRTAAPDLRAAVDQQNAAQGQAAGGPLPADLLAGESRRLVTVRVLHELIVEKSRREGVVVTPARVDEALARVGGAEGAARGSGFDPATIRELVGDQLAAADLGRREFDRLSVTVDYASAPDRAAAEQLAARVVADPAGARALFAGLPAGTGAADLQLRPGADQGNGVSATASSLIFGLPQGTVAITSSASGEQAGDPATSPWTVIHVRERRLDAPPPAGPIVPSARVDDDTMFGFGLRLLQPLALTESVTVSPRYGAWDPTQLDVVESTAAAGTITPVRAPAP